MKQPTKYFVIGVFLLVNITDIITTVLAGSKHGFSNEANIFYIMTGSLALTFILKWAMVFFFIALFLYKYDRWKTIVRYAFFLFVSMLIMTLFVVSVNNYLVYKTPVEAYRTVMIKSYGNETVTKEQKMEYTRQRYSNPLTSLLMFCMITFMFYNWIENERKTPKTR